MKKIKLAVIGGGSSYTPELVEGLVRMNASLPVGELVLVDIKDGIAKARINEALTRRMLLRAGLDAAVSATTDRRAALKGADFVISQIRVGGLKARSADERIPVKYGLIGQETTGPGGFSKALRTIPVMLALCRDIEEICPEAWLVNFTNPSGIITEAVHSHSKVKCIGLCNVPITMEKTLKNNIAGGNAGLTCRFTGLNHLSVITHVYLGESDLIHDLTESGELCGRIVKEIMNEDISPGLIRALGFIPSSYLRYYYFEKKIVEEQRKNIRNGSGTRADEVMRIEKKLFELYGDPDLAVKPAELAQRGGAYYSEAAIELIDSIYNDRSRVHVVNAINGNSVPDLPKECIVETNCVVGRGGAAPLPGGDLPPAIRGLVQHAKAYEQLTIEAAVCGDYHAALAALVSNPLVHDIQTATKVLDELLDAHKKYLPAFIV